MHNYLHILQFHLDFYPNETVIAATTENSNGNPIMTAFMAYEVTKGNFKLTSTASVQEEKEPATGDDYEGMSAKELFTLCKEKGLDVEAKKSKEYYIEQLSK